MGQTIFYTGICATIFFSLSIFIFTITSKSKNKKILEKLKDKY